MSVSHYTSLIGKGNRRIRWNCRPFNKVDVRFWYTGSIYTYNEDSTNY